MKKAVLLLAAQFVCCLVPAVGAVLLRPIPWLSAVLIWALLMPFAALSAFLLVKNGVNAYLCWFLPPLALFCASCFLLGFLTGGGKVFACALAGITGAATGESNNKLKRKGRK